MNFSIFASILLLSSCFLLPNVRFLASMCFVFQLYLCVLSPPFWQSHNNFVFTNAPFSKYDVLSSVDFFSLWFLLLLFSTFFIKAFLIRRIGKISYSPDSNTVLKSISQNWHPYSLMSKRSILYTSVMIIAIISSILSFPRTGLRRISNQFALVGICSSSIALLRDYKFALLPFVLSAAQYQFTGFRYTLLLLFFPVMLSFLNNFTLFNPLKRFPWVVRLLMFTLFALFGIFFFSAMTVLRSKFSSTNIFHNLLVPVSIIFTSPLSENLNLLGLPFFMDSNIIFAHTAVIFPRHADVYYSIFNFLNDILVEFLPSFIFSDKSEPILHYLVRSQFGGGLTSLQSAILFPICTPFVLMLGNWFGIIVSAVLSGLAICFSEFLAIPKRISSYSYVFSFYIQIAVVFPLLYALVFRGFPPFVLKVFLWGCLPSALLIRQTILDYSKGIDRRQLHPA